MAKTKTPFHSFKAHGSIAGSVTYQDRNRATMVRRKPTPTDRKSLPQIYHRWLYQDGAALWHTLSVSQKEQWESDARPFKITGFNYFMRTYLTTFPDIAASYHLDFPLGASVTDFSNNANHAVLYGPHFVQGVIDHALFFDGIDDHAIAPLIDAYKFTGPFSLDLFARRKAQTGSWQSLVSTESGETSGYALASLDDGTLLFYVWGLTPHSIGTTTPIMQNDLLLHIAAVYTGQNLQLFINGTLDNSIVVTGTPSIPTLDFYLGRYPGAAMAHYNGILDHLILYNRALSPYEIQRHSLRRYPL